MEVLATRADYVGTASSEDGEHALGRFKLSGNQKDHVLAIPTDQLPNLLHAAASAYTYNRQLLGARAGPKPAFAVTWFDLETHTATGGYVLTLTIDGVAE